MSRLSFRQQAAWTGLSSLALPLASILCLGLSLGASAAESSRLAPQSASDAAAPHVHHAKTAAERAPQQAQDQSLRNPRTSAPKTLMRATAAAATAACDPNAFTVTGSTLVSRIQGATVDCVNQLFSLKGSTAAATFSEANMSTVAYALRDQGARYAGDNSLSTLQLILFMRAGYYVQFYDSSIPAYGSGLKTAVRSGLDSFFANSKALTKTAGNAPVLAEAVTLIDSSTENARYLPVVKSLLASYQPTDASNWDYSAAVNNTFTVLWRGHQNADYKAAVQNDTSVVDSIYQFTLRNQSLLGTSNGYLPSNGAREMARFLQYSGQKTALRPKIQDLLNRSSITGASAAQWMALADMVDYYDQASCSTYGLCDYKTRVAQAVLPTTTTCSSTLTLRSQALTADQIQQVCTSVINEEGYFHDKLKTNRTPVAGDLNSKLELVVFHSSQDYATYSGALFGNDTNNGGIYLEGNPSQAGNQARFLAYEAEWVRPAFQVWNLNHEYTHYMDGRFNMAGDFSASVSTPQIWWIEGLAEYISYSYRGVPYTDALNQAKLATYPLSTLMDTTYNNDQTRIYNWGYLATRYMFERHPADVTTLLGHFRQGNYTAARTFEKSTIGTRYDADFASWLSCVGSGKTDCAGTLPACTGGDSMVLGQNCARANQSATQGNYRYFYVYMPKAGRLTFNVSGGTGNADLYYSAAGWPQVTSFQRSSTSAGNTEQVVVTNAQPGYHYIAVHAKTAYSGVSVSASY